MDRHRELAVRLVADWPSSPCLAQSAAPGTPALALKLQQMVDVVGKGIRVRKGKSSRVIWPNGAECERSVASERKNSVVGLLVGRECWSSWLRGRRLECSEAVQTDVAWKKGE